MQSYDRAVARFKKNLVATGVGLVLVPALIYLVVVVTGSVFSGKPFEHVAVAFQRTVAFSKGTYIGEMKKSFARLLREQWNQE
ncbi:MAG: hypothetical protein UU92_C0005G0047 [candidate division WWE3 bacterium GW2011_GWA1_42_12]|nr:MAG: hypothetical protein UU92_C0005G0047 [candidate division WWE3 bacterium GW2011_GWA1_42_12]